MRILFRSKRFSEAADALQGYLHTNNNDALSWFRLGICYEHLGKLEAAKRCLLRAQQLVAAPSQADLSEAIRFHLSRIYISLGEFEEAVALTSSSRLHPVASSDNAEHNSYYDRLSKYVSIEARCTLANDQFDQSCFQSSRQTATEVLRFIPTTSDYCTHKAYAEALSRTAQSNTVQLKRQFANCVRLRPQSASAWYDLALSTYRHGTSSISSNRQAKGTEPDTVAAQVCAQASLILDPLRVQCWILLSRCLSEEQAMLRQHCLMQGIKFLSASQHRRGDHPDSAVLWIALAALWTQMRLFEKAKQALDIAQRIDPFCESLWSTRAILLREQGSTRDAVGSAFHRANELRPSVRMFCFFLCYTHYV